MSRELPSGWKLATLNEICAHIARGDAPKYAESITGIWALSQRCIRDEGIDRDFLRPHSSEKRVKEQSILQPGDVCINSTGTGTLGRVGFWPGSDEDVVFADTHVTVLRANEREALPRFLFEWLRSEATRERIYIECVTGSTNQIELSRSSLMSLSLLLPPLHEQRRIAEILSSVDETIASTRAVIEQTRKVKQSSLGALFHRGNWTDAELPAGHNLARLEDVARRGSGHTPSKKFSEYWNGGIAWVSLQDTKALDRRHIDKTAANISDLGVKNSSAEVHPAGTVFVSRDATVGKVGITQTPMAVSQHFIAWACGPMLDNLFLYYWLLNMKPIFERIAAGSTIKTIGLGFFKDLQIALPDMATQKRIASQMMAIDDALDGNEAWLDELKALKSALMSDLLTGRKRVTDALPMAAE